MRLALDGVFAPAAGVCVAAGAGWVAGVGPTVGLAAAAMLAAAVFVVPVLGSEWGDQVSVSRERMEQVRGGSRRGPEALGRLRGRPTVPPGRRASGCGRSRPGCSSGRWRRWRCSPGRSDFGNPPLAPYAADSGRKPRTLVSIRPPTVGLLADRESASHSVSGGVRG